MSRWSWKGTQWKGKWSAPWQWKGQDDQSEDDEGRAASKLIFTEGNPWLTPTESCATEQEEEKLVRAPLASDRLETQLARCQCSGAENAENHLHPRFTQMKDMRPLEGEKTEQASDS